MYLVEVFPILPLCLQWCKYYSPYLQIKKLVDLMSSSAKTTTAFRITGDVTAKMIVEIIPMKKTVVSNFYLSPCYNRVGLAKFKRKLLNFDKTHVHVLHVICWRSFASDLLKISWPQLKMSLAVILHFCSFLQRAVSAVKKCLTSNCSIIWWIKNKCYN